jgi:hypothetical protein
MPRPICVAATRRRALRRDEPRRARARLRPCRRRRGRDPPRRARGDHPTAGDPCLRGARQPRLALHGGRAALGRAGRRGRADGRPQLRDRGRRRLAARRRRGEGLRRRLPRLAAPGLRRAAPAGRVRRNDRRGRRARCGPGRDRRLRLPDRAAPLRPDADDARGQAARDLGVPRLRPAGRAAPRTPSAGGPPRPRPCGAFQGAVGDVPVYNVAVPVLGSDFVVLELDVEGVRPT